MKTIKGSGSNEYDRGFVYFFTEDDKFIERMDYEEIEGFIMVLQDQQEQL